MTRSATTQRVLAVLFAVLLMCSLSGCGDKDAGSTDAQVAAVLDPLPQALRDRLVRANAQDLALYDRATALISRDHRP